MSLQSLTLASRPGRAPRSQRPLRVAVAAAVFLLVAGCSILGPRPEPGTIYAPDPRVQVDPAWPTVDWQMSLSRATAGSMTDSLRITVRPSPNELQVYKGASWAKTPTSMVEDALLRALEDSNRIPAVARQGAGISADYKLVLDLRRFEADYVTGGSTPTATIEVNAKLLHVPDQAVIAARTFLQAPAAASTAVPDVVAAFEQSLETLTGELAGWVLASGDAHEQTAHD
ncbi:ABC-type transport auxiliary lipoprotein family protein [Lysobacter sp. F60174L2]|uniref:ABC-type transport auxiliary lipoprotein family protein n=1 Tax=Lysobacter sp. F60174L2 TaxID=3459295 RepID=UPI00403DB6CF